MLVLVAGLMAPAQAQLQLPRPIPEAASRGIVRHAFETLLSIDGRTVAMAAGAVIRNTDNLIIVPAALPAQGALAAYTLDASGQVTRMWLLTEQEAAARPGKPSYSN